MKMTFSKEKYLKECEANGIPTDYFGVNWWDVIDGRVFDFQDGQRTSVLDGYAVSKDWCVPCDDDRTAREMFEALGFEFIEDDSSIKYERRIKKERKDVVFYKEGKMFDAYDYREYDAMKIDGELLKAINKQMQELGWI